MNYLKDLRTFKSGAVLGKSDLQKFIGVEKNLPSSLQKHLDNLAWAPQIYNFISKVYRRPCFSFFLKKKSYIVKHIWLPCGISICQKSTVNANIVSKLSAFHDYFPHLWFLECTWATDCSHVTPPQTSSWIYLFNGYSCVALVHARFWKCIAKEDKCNAIRMFMVRDSLALAYSGQKSLGPLHTC